jgi:hypothetical protein
MKSLTIYLIIGLIALLLGGIFGYLIARGNMQNEISSLREQRQELRNEKGELEREITKQRERANRLLTWRSYTNEQYNFQIGYPEDWELTTDSQEGLAVITNYKNPEEESRQLRENQAKRILTTEDNRKKLSAREFQAEALQDRIIGSNTIESGDMKAEKIELSGALGKYFRVYFPDKENNRFIILTSAGEQNNLDDMIRSFKFTRNISGTWNDTHSAL